MIVRWSPSCVVSRMDPSSLTPKYFLHPGEFDGMDLKHEEFRRTVEQWFTESRTMYADAYETIKNVRRVQNKLIEQRRTLGDTHRMAPWVEG
jgi:hypothetical protein